MAIALEKKFRRKNPRVSGLNANITGLLSDNFKGEFQPFLVWDCSEAGLGIWTPNLVKIGEEVSMTIGTPFILQLKGKVTWSTRAEGGDGYRAGIDLGMDQEDKLSCIFAYFVNPDPELES